MRDRVDSQHQSSLDAGQRFKYTRIRQDYDLFKYITGLSGVGFCPETGMPMVDDEVWEHLMPSKHMASFMVT
ncbi:hypothetical protein L915_08887 [Phytophthora nicotianae]|uniref:Uncharacterized protein n=1 Tax=Phytophthora nicotianae TaxID=4792 RepID=W2GU58_PHYNI|nr:hypothetical protein L915_08887 [Phytophthora nicotianae]